MKRDKKLETRKELAQAGIAVAPRGSYSRRWSPDQYLPTNIQWVEHLRQLRRAGERMRLERPGADPELWQVTLVHTGGYVFSYYHCTARITHEHFTTEDLAGTDPAWVLSVRIKREVKYP